MRKARSWVRRRARAEGTILPGPELATPNGIQITAKTRRVLTRPYALRRREVVVRGKGRMPTYLLDPAAALEPSLAPVTAWRDGMPQPDARPGYSPA
jgi:hypothetical protein